MKMNHHLGTDILAPSGIAIAFSLKEAI